MFRLMRYFTLANCEVEAAIKPFQRFGVSMKDSLPLLKFQIWSNTIVTNKWLIYNLFILLLKIKRNGWCTWSIFSFNFADAVWNHFCWWYSDIILHNWDLKVKVMSIFSWLITCFETYVCKISNFECSYFIGAIQILVYTIDRTWN